ncbi:hypothetical protein ACS0TY_024466 [Phlomoides rotata]
MPNTLCSSHHRLLQLPPHCHCPFPPFALFLVDLLPPPHHLDKKENLNVLHFSLNPRSFIVAISTSPPPPPPPSPPLTPVHCSLFTGL